MQAMSGMNAASQLLIVCPLVFFAALVDSIAGGGGLISLPAYLLTGLPPQLASGTNKFSASMGTLIAAIRYGRGGFIRWMPTLLGVAGALPGAYLGAEALKALPEGWVRTILLGALPLAALAAVLRRETKGEERPFTAARKCLCVGIGLVIGFYDGFIGPGTGTFLILLYNMALGMDMVTASAGAKVVNLASNAAALFSFLQSGHVLFWLGIPAMACAMLGGAAGSKLAMRRGASSVRFVMLMVFGLMLAKLVYDFLA